MSWVRLGPVEELVDLGLVVGRHDERRVVPCVDDAALGQDAVDREPLGGVDVVVLVGDLLAVLVADVVDGRAAAGRRGARGSRRTRRRRRGTPSRTARTSGSRPDGRRHPVHAGRSCPSALHHDAQTTHRSPERALTATSRGGSRCRDPQHVVGQEPLDPGELVDDDLGPAPAVALALVDVELDLAAEPG